jgi:hypothetical protein
VTGGGLTVIANAPNPAGFSILRGSFQGSTINALSLLLAVVVLLIGVLNYFGIPQNAAGMAATGAIAGAVGGGLNAALAGGNLADILRGATVGAVQGAISGGILNGLTDGIGFDSNFLYVTGHGIVGGGANEAMGGKFQDGFFSAAAGTAAAMAPVGGSGIYVNTIKAGVAGGTASVIGGGKFSNGAFTAAFQHLTARIVGSVGNGKAPGNLSDEEKIALEVSGSSYLDNNGGYLSEYVNSYKATDGFSASLYGSQEKGFWLVFRGTQLTSWLDWKNNVLQALGFPSKQYRMAISLGKEIYARTNGRVIFAGHSLGGGLASAAARWTGARAYTFNAAGLHPWTASGLSGDIRALWLQGDILSAIQDSSPLPRAAGTRIAINPASRASMIANHGLDKY